jgi:hypothetical protein
VDGCNAPIVPLPRNLDGVSYYTRLDVRDPATGITPLEWILGTTIESCDNGIDDNCDGRIDCEDTSCSASGACCGHDGMPCCPGSACVDSGLTCDPNSKRCAKTSLVPEGACNFSDDDNDGQVDEGNDWQVGTWSTLLTGSFIRHFRAIPLTDGRMAVAGYDDTRFYAIILSPSGAVAAGPFIGDLLAPNVSEIDLVENTAEHELAVVAGTNNYFCAATGCPIRMMRVDLGGSGTHSVGTLPVPYSAQYGARITLSGDKYVVAGGARAPVGIHLNWFDSTFSAPGRNVDLSDVVASMNISAGPQGLAWCEGLAPTLHCGVMTGDGAGVLLASKPVPDDGAAIAHNGTTGENGLLWSGNDMVIAYTRNGPPAQGRVFRKALDGAAVAGPVDVDGPGFSVSGISEYRGNFLVRTTSPDGTHHIHRLDRALQTVSSPGGPLVVQGYAYVSVVESSEGLFVIGARSDRLDIARLGCE